MGSEDINTVCYADDIALIAVTEGDLKRLLYNFHLSCLKCNMKISIHKTIGFSGRKNPEHKSSARDFKLRVPNLRFQAR